MKTKENLLFKIIFIYNIICSICCVIISLFKYKNIKIEINYDLMEIIVRKFIVMPMIISIPILCFIYISMVKKEEILQKVNNLEIVNESFGLKNLCMINIIHNIIFIFNLGYLTRTILEIIAIFIYLNSNKITTSKIYVNFISKIINKLVYIIFILIFLYNIYIIILSYSCFFAEKTSNGGLGLAGSAMYLVAVYPMLVSVPYLYLIYLYFNKKINNCNNVKINFIFKLICGITIIHNLVFPFNMFYSIPLFILEIGLIIIYLLYIFSKIKLRFKLLIKIIIWIILIVIYFKTSYLLAFMLTVFRFF